MRKNHLSCVSAAAPSAEFRIACTPEPGWRKVYLFRFRIVRTDQSWFTSLLRLLYAKMANKIYTRFPKASHRPTLMSCFLVNLRATTARMYQPFFYTKGLRMAFFEFLHGVQEVEGSNPFAPTIDRLCDEINHASGLRLSKFHPSKHSQTSKVRRSLVAFICY